MSAQSISMNMAARGRNGVTLASLKRDVNLAARSFHSKYRHKGKFANSLGRHVIGKLPLYAVILIFIGVFLAVLFIAGLIFFGEKERRRASRSGSPMQWKGIFWNATKYALFLWIPIYIFNAIKHRSVKGKPSSYAEISEDQQRLNNPAVTETKPWNASNAPADEDAKFEPLGYKSQIYDPYSAYAGVEQPSMQAAASPDLSRSAGPSVAPSPPTTAGLHQPPPPEAGDLGARSPSPARASFASPSQPPPTYYN